MKDVKELLELPKIAALKKERGEQIAAEVKERLESELDPDAAQQEAKAADQAQEARRKRRPGSRRRHRRTHRQPGRQRRPGRLNRTQGTAVPPMNAARLRRFVRVAALTTAAMTLALAALTACGDETPPEPPAAALPAPTAAAPGLSAEEIAARILRQRPNTPEPAPGETDQEQDDASDQQSALLPLARPTLPPTNTPEPPAHTAAYGHLAAAAHHDTHAGLLRTSRRTSPAYAHGHAGRSSGRAGKTADPHRRPDHRLLWTTAVRRHGRSPQR